MAEGGKHLGVVGTDNGSHVLGAAVADLNGIPVKYAPVPMAFVEVNINELENLPRKLGFHTEVERGVIPNYVPGSLFLSNSGVDLRGAGLHRWWRELKLVVEPAAFQGIFVLRFCIVERFRITRDG